MSYDEPPGPVAHDGAHPDAHGDVQPGLLEHLTLDGHPVGLTGLHPPAGHRPEATTGLPAPAYDEEAAVVVVHECTHTGDTSFRRRAVREHARKPRHLEAPCSPS